MSGSLESRLTAQERVVLPLVCRGLSNDEIGDEIKVSEGTAKAHVSSLFRKFGVINRAQLAAKAVALGLVRMEDAESEGEPE